MSTNYMVRQGPRGDRYPGQEPVRTPEDEQRSHTARMLTPDALTDMWRSYEAVCHERGVTPRYHAQGSTQ